jgi:tetratricopeptide (TPR) repeat protein
MAPQHIKHKQILKTLKRDELREFIDRIMAFSKSNTENLLISVIIVVVLAILVPMYFKHRAENEMRASNLLDRAISVSMQPVQGEASGFAQGFKNYEEKYRKTLEAYQEVSTTYHGTRVAILAKLGEAQCWFYLKDYAKAMGVYTEALGKHADDFYTPGILDHMGACLENQQKWGEALKSYQDLLQRFPAYYGRRAVRLAEARCQASLGKLDEARRILAEEAAVDPGSAASEAARQQLALLK